VAIFIYAYYCIHVIGYGTKIVAIKMMFEPLEFFGIKPFLGWQGIIPRKAAQMSAIACDTLTSSA
jgi:uncharacterized membrane protein YheB (UPF0754 family)